jgi:hypothetical protein
MCRGSQDVCATAEQGEGFLGLRYQLLQSRPCALDAQEAYEGRLMRRGVFAGRFADGGGVALDIKQIVRNLKGFADRRAIAIER